ncbi:hypothetical protein CDAR_309461 [Caerostris darwini]|uniref:Uncharacterized protein n=1 Tax=Caerostris darwini TaxID=1538125 RepID=A0AAV4SDP4_9ARAC|nr:hypothetical protein CDAR_309461 [Caerostris darwini]
MDENLRRIQQYLGHMNEAIENTILLASNIFNRMEQVVDAHTSLDPETLTADECHARESELTILINRLQELRKETENIMNIYEIIVCDNSGHLNMKLNCPLFNIDNGQQVIERIILVGNGLISGNMTLGI